MSRADDMRTDSSKTTVDIFFQINHSSN